MCRFLEKITGGYKSRASVAGGKLILSFPDALAPSVWQMDLTSSQTSSVELEAGKDGIYALVFKEGKKAKETIAKYNTRGKAVRALMTTSNAIEKSLAQIAPGTPVGNNAPSVIIQKGSFIGSLFKGVFVTIFVIVIVGLIILFGLNTILGTRIQQQAGQQVAPSSSSTTNSVGKPMSADDFLKGK